MVSSNQSPTSRAATRSTTRAANASTTDPALPPPAPPVFLGPVTETAPTIFPEVTPTPTATPAIETTVPAQTQTATMTPAITTPETTTAETAPAPAPTVQAPQATDPDFYELFSDEEEGEEEEVIGEILDSTSDDGDDDDLKSDMELEEGEDPKFVLNYWDGSPPVPTGKVALLFNKIPILSQFTQIEDLIKASPHTNPTFALNDINTPFLVAIGNNRKLKVIYNVRNADKLDLFKDTDIESNLLALTGEYIPGVQIPSTLVLPKSALTARSVKVPDGDDFAKKRRDFQLHNKPTWFNRSAVQRVADVMPIIPAPACILYDAFDGEIDAMVVYERWMQLREQFHFYKFNALLRHFLKAQTVSTTKREVQTKLPEEVFLEAPPSIVNEWKILELQKLFPSPASTSNHQALPAASTTVQQTVVAPGNSLIYTATHPVAPVPPSTIQPPTTPLPVTNSTPVPNQDQLMERTAAIVVQAMQAFHQYDRQNRNGNAPPTTTNTSESTQSTELDLLGMPRFGFDKIMVMAGLVPGEENLLPMLYWNLAQKGMAKSDKKSLTKVWIKDNVFYPDAKVQPYTPLITMVINRDFEEDTSMSTRRSAARGLTIFAVPTLSDVDYNKINELAAALEQATQTTVKDITTSSFEAQAPKSFFQLTKLIKRFANLNYAIFGPSCSLFLELQKLVGFLDDYGDTAIGSMTKRTMASITWIIHMQSRHFAAGLMSPPKILLTEFHLMMTAVESKQQVTYGDVPTEMYESNPAPTSLPNFTPNHNPTKRKAGGELERPGEKKRPKIVKIEVYHPKIKEAMSVFNNRSKLPRVKALCDTANTDANNLFPSNKNLCIKSALFGTCFSDCKRSHSPISDSDATRVLTLLKPALDYPENVKVTK